MVLDHRKEAVVVAVRGTMSVQVMMLCLTDSDVGTGWEQKVSHRWGRG